MKKSDERIGTILLLILVVLFVGITYYNTTEEEVGNIDPAYTCFVEKAEEICKSYGLEDPEIDIIDYVTASGSRSAIYNCLDWENRLATATKEFNQADVVECFNDNSFKIGGGAYEPN